jgi:hypothetical protein
MKTLSLKSLLTKAALVTLLPATVLAEPVQEWRCTSDSLETSQALQRIDWARRCGLLTNGSATTPNIAIGPNNTIISDKAWDQTMDWAKDYKEANTNKAFSGNSNQYNVNFYHAWSKFGQKPAYTVMPETSGPTVNYLKWSSSTPRARPYYPTFESTVQANTGIQLFPHPTFNDCRLYKDKNGQIPWTGDATNPSANFYVVAYCEASCYAPDQKLLFSDGEANIVEAMKQGREDLMTLSPDATLDSPSLQKNTVYSYTSEIRDAEHVIYEINTASGGQLRLTNEHPVINSEGRLVKAESLVEGDELLKADGTPDKVVSVQKTTHFGKVYNVKPVSRDPVSNILVAQGYLVGSARFQNDDVEYMNRVLLFRSVPEQVMPE